MLEVRPEKSPNDRSIELSASALRACAGYAALSKNIFEPIGTRELKRLKLLMITRLFPSSAFPSFGTFCMERAKSLSAHADVRVMVPTPYYPRWLPGRTEWKKWISVERRGTAPPGLKVTYPRYISIPGTATFLQGLAMARCVQNELIESYGDWRPDVIDGHFAFPDGYSAVKLGQAIGVPAVVTCHGSDLRQYPDIPLAGAMTRWTLKTADRVISVSSDLQRRSIELGCPQGHSVLLSNGVDPDKFTLREKNDCRNLLGLPLDRKIGVQVAALIDLKGQSLMLDALAEIRNRGELPPFLVFVGSGPNALQLKRQISDLGLMNDVLLAGQKTHSEVAVFMGAADWLVVASSSEGWATVYFEAMACGRPVITSNVSSAKDAVCDAAYGMVVEPRTPAAFATALQTASLRLFDAAKIRAYSEQHSWAIWAYKALNVFHPIIKNAERHGA